MEELRKCNCGSEAEIKTEVYPNTEYKMYRICCKSCFVQTEAKRKLDVAIREWNNPYSVELT